MFEKILGATCQTVMGSPFESKPLAEFQENTFSNDKDIRKCQSICMTPPLPTTGLGQYLDFFFENSRA